MEKAMNVIKLKVIVHGITTIWPLLMEYRNVSKIISFQQRTIVGGWSGLH